jgi:serine/threonine protein kinase
MRPTRAKKNRSFWSTKKNQGRTKKEARKRSKEASQKTFFSLSFVRSRPKVQKSTQICRFAKESRANEHVGVVREEKQAFVWLVVFKKQGEADRDMAGDGLERLTVPVLKERLDALGLAKAGLKKDLVARLRAHAKAGGTQQKGGRRASSQKEEVDDDAVSPVPARRAARGARQQAKPAGSKAAPKRARAKSPAAAAPKPKPKQGGRKVKTPSELLELAPGHIVRNTVPTYERVYVANGPGFPVPSWRLIRRVGGGAEGDVWLAEGMSDEQGTKLMKPHLEVALKVADDTSRLFYEVHNFTSMGCHTRGAQEAGLPRLYGHGIDKSGSTPAPVKFIAMEYLGDTIGDVYKRCEGFDGQTLRLIGANMVRALRYMHQRGFIYRDMSYNNMMIGSGDNSDKLYIIDVGVAQKINDLGNTWFSGAPAFASANALRPKTKTGPADDLVALAHVLVYFDLGGTLPWMARAKPSNKKENLTQKVLEAAANERDKDYPAIYKDLMCHELQDFLEAVLPLTEPDNFSTKLSEETYDELLDLLLAGLPDDARYEWASGTASSRKARTPKKERGRASSAARSPVRASKQSPKRATAAARSPKRAVAVASTPPSRASPKPTARKSRGTPSRAKPVIAADLVAEHLSNKRTAAEAGSKPSPRATKRSRQVRAR